MKSLFLIQIRDVIRSRHYSIRTEKSYWYWISHYIRFHQCRHPKDINENHIREFLAYLALQRNVAASTQKTALNAIVFMYRTVLQRNLNDFSDFYRAQSPKKLPTVLTKEELKRLFTHLRPNTKICAALMYGSGLRLIEIIRLRVQDIDFNKLTVLVRESKGRTSRFTTLSPDLIPLLKTRWPCRVKPPR